MARMQRVRRGEIATLPRRGEECVHRLFEYRVLESPDSVAVVAGDEQLTYRELDQLTNMLAHRLASLGITRESRVAVCAEPSLSLAVAILGVLKAGAAYVPLEPSHPADHLRQLLTDSRADLVVVQDGHADICVDTGVDVLVLDRSWQSIRQEPNTRLDLDVHSDGIACVIYTSGSTGHPKGVVISHRGLANLACAAAAEFGLQPGDRFLQLASISFSASLEELFPPLVTGGTLVLAGYRRALAGSGSIIDLLRAEYIVGFEVTTAYWHQLMDELAISGTTLPESVRFVVVGGDRACAEDVLAWRKTGIPLINVYGPTETTATASYYHSAKEIRDNEGVLPIGRAIQDCPIHLLGPEMVPVRGGAVGEIHIGGVSLARGYWNQPGKTAEVFVPDPFGSAGERLYRTGDLARALTDGTIEFLGRVDSQVKVRGIRVEPGEIEAALLRHPKVRQALVAASGDSAEDRYLVAYFTAGRDGPPEDSDLREHLSTILPDPMIPAMFVAVDKMPLTPNGKVDRAAPPNPGNGRPAALGPFTVPTPGTQTELAALWTEVLKRGPIGCGDDFFALGGNSLQAVRIVAKARRLFDVELAPNDLLSDPTIDAFARRIDLLRTSAPAPHDVGDDAEMKHWRDKRGQLEEAMASRVGDSRASLIALSQQNLWMLSKFLPGTPLYNEAWQCRLHGPLNLAGLRHAITEITRRHETFRTRIDMIGFRPVQLVSAAADVWLEYYDLAEVEEQERLGAAYATRDKVILDPLSPAAPPLVKAWAFRLTDYDHLLVLNMHHIVWDGISKEVFLDELVAFYQAFGTGAPPALPSLPMQYGDFALWQRSYLTGPARGRLVDFWRKQLADPPPPLPLPEGRTPVTQDYAGAKVVLPLPPLLRDQVTSLARLENVTPFMVLLTALCGQLHNSLGQTDICVGTPMANRMRAGIESLIGCFINSVPLRMTISDGLTGREALARVRATCLDAIEHQELPFDVLLEELRPERQAGRSPYFQTWFAFEDETLLPRKTPDLTIDGFSDLSMNVSKLELNWIVVDRGDQYIVSLAYRTGLFDEATAQAMVDLFRVKLEELVSDPGSEFVASTSPVVPQSDGTQVSQALLTLWRQIFNNDAIQPDDDFFELGGYSMLAVHVVTGIHELFGVEISFTEFFDNPNVATLAEKVVEAKQHSANTEASSTVRPSEEHSLEEILVEVERFSV
jgi:amino acid adenylation domain-containing protein